MMQQRIKELEQENIELKTGVMQTGHEKVQEVAELQHSLELLSLERDKDVESLKLQLTERDKTAESLEQVIATQTELIAELKEDKKQLIEEKQLF